MLLKQYIKRGIQYVFKGIPNKVVNANIYYLQPNHTLLGKKIIITGGGRGLGAAMAKKFVLEGAEVLIAGRNENTLKETALAIGCKYLKLDVSDVSSFEDFIKKADLELDGINVLVNNAGISLHEETFFDVTPDTFDKQINTNFRGAFFMTQTFISYLKKTNKNGNVLFISSETGETMDCRPYGFTKAAINSMVKGLANLFAKDEIRINAIAPGITASDMTGLPKEGNIYFGGNIIERIYMPEEMAEISAFLVSDAAYCISGQIITCNNAKTINVRWR